MARIVRLDHIALVVKDLEQAIAHAEEKYGARFLSKDDNEEQKYTVAVLQLGENIISLIAPTEESSFVGEFLNRHGEGIQHLGLEVDNLEEYVKELESRGVRVPVKQFEGKGRKEALVSPKDAFGTVLQLIEWEGGTDTSPEERIARMMEYHNPDPTQ